MSGEPLPLRPHHGLCLAFFQGLGYSESFIAHMAACKRVLESGALIRLTCGVDAICSACPNNLGHRCRTSDLVAGYDNAVLSLCGLREGTVLPYAAFAASVVEAILRPGLRNTVCAGCQWEGACRGAL